MKQVSMTVTDRFEDFIFDWDYETYLCIGGYGSGKSYAIAEKIILKCLQEKRKVLIVREVAETLKDSCFDLLYEIMDGMDILADPGQRKQRMNKVWYKQSPMTFYFPNGSRILFKGMDKPEKVKSINGVSIVWLEECSEVKYAGYEELLGRLRTPGMTMHFLLSCNPVSKENWVYRHFFKSLDEDGNEVTIVDDEKLYEKHTLVHNGVYYMHSVPDDNPFLPKAYLRRLDNIKNYDYPLYRVARFGRFGPSGLRVLPQVRVVHKDRSKWFKEQIARLGIENQYFGFDFGFETSYNAVISMSVDQKEGILYIWDEIYRNQITDDLFAKTDQMQALKERLISYHEQGYEKSIIADNEDPKAITYYRQNGFRIRACRNKFVGSRLSNTRKVKRFHKIVISPKCKNTIRELKDLTYKKKPNGDTIYDEFNIDPHTFSAIWYALDTVTVADLKDRQFNSKTGEGYGVLKGRKAEARYG